MEKITTKQLFKMLEINLNYEGLPETSNAVYQLEKEYDEMKE